MFWDYRTIFTNFHAKKEKNKLKNKNIEKYETRKVTKQRKCLSPTNETFYPKYKFHHKNNNRSMSLSITGKLGRMLKVLKTKSVNVIRRKVSKTFRHTFGFFFPNFYFFQKEKLIFQT